MSTQPFMHVASQKGLGRLAAVFHSESTLTHQRLRWLFLAGCQWVGPEKHAKISAVECEPYTVLGRVAMQDRSRPVSSSASVIG